VSGYGQSGGERPPFPHLPSARPLQRFETAGRKCGRAVHSMHDSERQASTFQPRSLRSEEQRAGRGEMRARLSASLCHGDVVLSVQKQCEALRRRSASEWWPGGHMQWAIVCEASQATAHTTRKYPRML